MNNMTSIENLETGDVFRSPKDKDRLYVKTDGIEDESFLCMSLCAGIGVLEEFGIFEDVVYEQEITKKLKDDLLQHKNPEADTEKSEMTQEETQDINITLNQEQALTLLTVCQLIGGSENTSRRGDMAKIGKILTNSGVSRRRATMLIESEVVGGKGGKGTIFFTDKENPWEKASTRFRELVPGEIFRVDQDWTTGVYVLTSEKDTAGNPMVLSPNNTLFPMSPNTVVFKESVLKKYGI